MAELNWQSFDKCIKMIVSPDMSKSDRQINEDMRAGVEGLKQLMLQAEHVGRHAEVVKALFLMESIPGYDVKGWLQKRLAELKG